MSPVRQSICALAAFGLATVLQSWPLPAHLFTRLTGSTGSDTGSYVWNTWVFRRELLHGRFPLFTNSIFWPEAPADLTLHNYTPFADLITLPLQPVLGVVGAFNVVYLLNVTLAGFGMFLLARRVCGRAVEAWLAGFVFAWSPFIVARSTAHFSLVAAAPLPFFLFCLDRAWHTRRLRDAIASGGTVAWAAFCDPYYAIYCVMLAIFVGGSRVVAIAPTGPARKPRSIVLLDTAIMALTAFIGCVYVTGGGVVRLASLSISIRTLYTPMLLLTTLVIARLLFTAKPRIVWGPLPAARALVRPTIIATAVAVILLSPLLYSLGVRAAQHRIVSAPVPWRSSAPGVDLLSFLVPNPNHPFAPSLPQWLVGEPGDFAERVASLSLVGLVIIALAWRYAHYRPSRMWVAITIGFASLAFGPFIYVAGVNTYIPTPWTLLRYVPILGEARVPARFAIVAMMGFCVLLASALVAISERTARRRLILTLAAVLLGLELLSSPRTLYSAEHPAVYQIIASDPRPVSVLSLPFGIRDGLSSLGDFSAASLYHQTLHGKPLIGGALSRISEQRKRFYRGRHVRGALIALSEGRTLTDAQSDRARQAADDFVTRSNLGFVVMDSSRVSPELREFVTDLLRLRKIDDRDGYELYVPQPQAENHSRPR